MSSIKNDFRHLCSPAMFFLAISMISWVIILIQNLGNKSKYCVGFFSCRVPHTGIIMAVKLIYILFWTWILNLICKNGHKSIAWFLVLLPYILFFILIGMIMINQ